MIQVRTEKAALLIVFLGVVWTGLAATIFYHTPAEVPPGEPQWFPGPRSRGKRGNSLGRSTAWLTICEIQGNGFSSPYAGQPLVTRGVVYADFDQQAEKGLYIQEQGCDQDPETSDGLFVYLGGQGDVAAVGDRVEVAGTVQEYFGQTEISAGPDGVTVLSEDHPLPEAVDLAPPFDDQAARRYFEALEGMSVRLDSALVVGPTRGTGETWVVRADLGVERVFQDDPRGTGVVVTVAPGTFQVEPPARVRDRIAGLTGPLTFKLGDYRLELTAEPVVTPFAPQAALAVQATPASSLAFDVATLNVQNLFDTHDEPGKEDPVPTAQAYQRKLNKLALAIREQLGEPALIALQEVENQEVLADLLSRPAIQASYGVVWVDGPDVRGIDVALLYRTDRVLVLGYQAHQGCTVLVDGLGPDGNRDVEAPANAVTCDTDQDGDLDGNRLFSRPPLWVRARVCAQTCPLAGEPIQGSFVDVELILNHWKSKSQDTAFMEYTLPRRMEQAQFAAALSRQVLSQDPSASLIVLGDFNDYPGSGPLGVLMASGLSNLMPRLEKPDRYTFIYRGVSQVLDHVLIDHAFAQALARVKAWHINADFPDVYAESGDSVHRGSDHDPVVVHFTLLPYKTYLPLGILDR